MMNEPLDVTQVLIDKKKPRLPKPFWNVDHPPVNYDIEAI